MTLQAAVVFARLEVNNDEKSDVHQIDRLRLKELVYGISGPMRRTDCSA